jgi:hypothetical protein
VPMTAGGIIAMTMIHSDGQTSCRYTSHSSTSSR